MLIPRSALAARKCSDTDSKRYALGGIFFTRDRDNAPLAVATDGRKLIALTWREDDPAEFPATQLDLTARLTNGDGFTVPTAACNELAKCKIGEKARKPILRNIALEEPADPAANSVRLLCTDIDQTANFAPKLQEGRFPHWQDCFPRPQSDSVNVQLEARSLIALLETIAAHCTDGNGDCPVVISLTADSPHQKAVTITAATATGNKAAAVIMPFGDGSRPVNQWQKEFNMNREAADDQPATDPPAAPAESPPVVDKPAADDTDLEPAAEADTVTESPAPRRTRPRKAAVMAAAGDNWEAGNY